MQSSCPTAVQLEGLLRGTLAPAESVALDEHLAHCAACRQRLNALAGDNESWLQAKEKSAADRFDSPPLREAMNRLKGTDLIPPSERAGDRIGRYKLLQKIGEGGCGVVYMAEQEEPVRRRVALKIIKLGMDTKSVIARFEGERQALALMDHPNIAKVFDAGATETGRPYFVMELVRGVKITDFCDEAKLSTRARLGLFIQVCQAIQHAHQKGIIHRDIKPSNILVSVNDGVPVPKVIDFGIAKATNGQQLTDKTLFTAFEQFIGTPAYMSPEQALMTNLDIDTRSDIYALGVLLYELLTGKTPFDAKELLAIGLDEIRRAIREQEPPRPSTRVSTLPDPELSTMAQRRGLDAPKLVSELRGDLDWIVMKCLEKDRARRYETANGLAADVQRHLNNETVLAFPPSNFYRFQKLVRRNKVAFTAGSAVVASLLIGLTLAMVLFFRERAARARASEQAAVAKAVSDFLQEDLLKQADTVSQGRAGFIPDSDLTVREVLERAADRIGDRFKDQPLQEAAVRMTIGRALGSIGEFGQSIPHFQRAIELRQANLSSSHPETLESMYRLALAYDTPLGSSERGRQLLKETLNLRRSVLGTNHPDTVNTMSSLASAYHFAGRDDKATAVLEEAVKLRQAIVGLDEWETRMMMRNLALAHLSTGRPERAVAIHEELVKVTNAKFGPDHSETAYAVSGLGWVYRETGKLDQVEALYRKWLSAKWTNGPVARLELGCVLLEICKTNHTTRGQELARESQQLLREYLADVRNRYTNNLSMLTGKFYDLADFYYRQGHYAEAEPLYREIIKRRGARWTKETSQVLEPTASLARLLTDWAWADRDKVGRAVPSALQPIADRGSAVETPLSAQQIAERAREGERLLRDVLVMRMRNSSNSWRIGDVKSRLGGALVSVAVSDAALNAENRNEKLAEAESLLLESHEQLKKRSSDKKHLRDAVERLVRLYEAWNKPEKRSEWEQKLELFDKQSSLASEKQ